MLPMEGKKTLQIIVKQQVGLFALSCSNGMEMKKETFICLSADCTKLKCYPARGKLKLIAI